MSKPIMSAKRLKKLLNHPDLVILDASHRTTEKGKKDKTTQIKGARFFDLKNIFRDKNNPLPNTILSPEVFEKECRKLGINKTSKIVIYDDIGVYLSPRAWWLFKVMGHADVHVLNGGLPNWLEKGYDVEKAKKTSYKKGNFKSIFKKEKIKRLKNIKKNIKSEKALVIDARTAGRFCGTAPEPREGLRSGHIPKSVNVPYQNVLKNGKFKSKAKLKKVFKEANKENRPLIFSCGSGITACIILMANELIMDNQKSVFDGSWTEWALAEGLIQ